MNHVKQAAFIARYRIHIGLTVLVLVCASYIGQTEHRVQAAADGNHVADPLPGESSQDSPFSEESIGNAVKSGVLVSLAAFVVFATYALFRAARRGELRSWLQEINSGLIKPLLRGRGKR